MAAMYRADQVGSLIRPAALLDAREAFRAGRIGRDALRRAEDEAVLGALAVQERAGMRIYTDGEMRRDAWQTVFSEAVDGFEPDYPVVEQVAADGSVVRVQMHIKAVSGTLRQRGRLAAADAQFLRAHAPGPFKITLPGPSCITRQSYRRGTTEAAYPDPGTFRQDVTGIMCQEIRDLAADGASYVQLDESFIQYVRPEWLDGVRQAGQDPDALIALDIATDNTCYDLARSLGMTTAMHLCQGSRTNAGRPTESFEWLAEHLFARLHVDCFLLEYDSERIRGFEPLRHLPRDKLAVLGLVSSKDPELEHEDHLLRRVEDAARFCPVERLAISSQCGFQGAANRDGAHMTADAQARKLELIVRVAERVWGTAGAVRTGQAQAAPT